MTVPSIRQALADASARLVASDTPRLDAELLLAHALRVSRNDLLLHHLDDPAPPTFAALIARRLQHEPVAYITGQRDFWTITLEVGPGVLIPRPDSETLIEAAVEHFRDRAPETILDLGTGPGTLLFAALDQWPNAIGMATDNSAVALDYARRNARRLGLQSRVRYQQSDWGAAIRRPRDLVFANPPYIAAGETLPDQVSRYEPAAALFAGPDGLDDYRVIASRLPHWVAPGGMAAIEIGHTQTEAVTALLVERGFTVAVKQDLAGRDRCLVATP